MKRQSLAVSCACFAFLAMDVASLGQQSSNLETGADGVTYQVTRQVVQRSIPVTEYQTREHKSFRPQVTTEYRSYPQTYVAPVTEYQWVARQRGMWPFVQPYWSHELVPITRWEARPGSVQIPVARTDWIEETRTTQVPVTSYRTVPEEYTSRVAVSAPPSGLASSAASVASRPVGGQQYQTDPPREGSPWNGASTYRR